MRIIPSMKGVLHLRYPTQREAAIALCRLDQFSEGAEEYRGKYFTHEQWKSEWKRLLKTGIDYFSYYEGWNIPSDTAREFFEVFDDLIPEEDLLYAAWFMSGKGYIIVDFEGADPTVMDHEVAHALYSLSAVYRERIQGIIERIPNHTYILSTECLIQAGYPENQEILDDEIHAYWMTSTDEELQEVFAGIPLIIMKHWQKQFKEIYHEETFTCITS